MSEIEPGRGYPSKVRTGPDWALRWPNQLFVSEAISILSEHPPGSGNWTDCARLLLEDAFAGTVPRDSIPPPESPRPGEDPRKILTDILLIADTFQQVEDRQPYFLERNRTAGRGPLGREAAQREFARSVTDLYARGYFAKDLYPGCVDDQDEQPTNVSAFIEERLGVADLWPLRATLPWEDDIWYSLIELFHDLAARPRSRRYHSWNECGYHHSDFAVAPGQELYRWTMDKLLARADVPYRLGESGEDIGRLISVTDDGRSELTERLLADHPQVATDPVAHSVSLFRRRGATFEDKRSAIVALAGVLEERRALLRQELLSRDESSLFEIANNYALRHRNENQRNEYAQEFLDWVFWLYAATVELTDRLLRRSG
jgi:hypothetical protein